MGFVFEICKISIAMIIFADLWGKYQTFFAYSEDFVS